jgi:hypothetical protein
MMFSTISKEKGNLPPEILALLPGPDRKRTATTYRYKLIYRNPADKAPGCVMLWEVSGGRLLYQIALERTEKGQLRIHCSCADAIFRAEEEGRCCKHVAGLVAEFQKTKTEIPNSKSKVRRKNSESGEFPV